MTRECLTEHFHPGYGDDEGYHTVGVWGLGYGTGEGHGRVNHCGERGAKTAGLEMTRECLISIFIPDIVMMRAITLWGVWGLGGMVRERSTVGLIIVGREGLRQRGWRTFGVKGVM